VPSVTGMPSSIHRAAPAGSAFIAAVRPPCERDLRRRRLHVPA
jgi:hypothetical protein